MTLQSKATALQRFESISWTSNERQWYNLLGLQHPLLHWRMLHWVSSCLIPLHTIPMPWPMSHRCTFLHVLWERVETIYSCILRRLDSTIHKNDQSEGHVSLRTDHILTEQACVSWAWGIFCCDIICRHIHNDQKSDDDEENNTFWYSAIGSMMSPISNS